VAHRADLRVKEGAKVVKGEPMTEGHLNLHDLMRLKGVEATRAYIIDEAKKLYALEGQNIDDRHLEVIVRQMFSKARVKDGGDSNLLAGEIVDWLKSKKIAEELGKRGKKPPILERLLLGITKVALKTESFLSAASFQETTRVLVDAAIQGKIDYLRGLKENVIIGRLIPAGTGFRGYVMPPERAKVAKKDLTKAKK
jgi:DNA-directed RNA polymerase subunit beta'